MLDGYSLASIHLFCMPNLFITVFYIFIICEPLKYIFFNFIRLLVLFFQIYSIVSRYFWFDF